MFLIFSFGCFLVYIVLEYVIKMVELFVEKGKYGVLKVIMFIFLLINIKWFNGWIYYGKVLLVVWSFFIS